MKNRSVTKENLQTALHYIKTFSDTAREPFLVLDPSLKVIGANESFYKNFLVTKEDVKNKPVYDLGNHQWDIPELRKLLEKILPNKKVFNDFEVSHKFPKIGLKIMLLNARQLDETNLILLAIEDITVKRAIEIRLANYTKELERGVATKTSELKIRADELEKINKLMLGREERILELKQEIIDLKNKKASE
jgi:hypothetical protein